MMKLKTLSMITLTAVAFGAGCGSSGNPGGGGGTGGTGNSATGGTGNAGGGNVAGNGGTMAACTNTANEGQGLDLSAAENNFVTAIYAFGDTNNGAVPATDTDPATTFCIVQPDGTTGQMCMNGTGAEACGGVTPCDYHRWGAGIGVQLSVHDATSGAITPFDAAAANIAGVSFNVTGVPTNGLRVQLTMPDDPATALPEGTGFVFGGGVADITADGPVTAMFTDFTQPDWGCGATSTQNPCGAGVVLDFDPTKLDALQFQVPTVAGSTFSYNFCVTDLKFLDSTGAVVTPPAGSGGSGGAP